jgi:glycosyltransferase involved in cell wall biosynthesis
MSKPLFSIITVTLNAQKYINDNFNSMDCQKGEQDWEQIIWDGGSTDNTLDICKKRPNIKVIQGSDQGIADAMNKAVLHAKGKFILFLHADDFLSCDQTLSFSRNFILSHPDSLWLYGIGETVDAEGCVLKKDSFSSQIHKKLKRYNVFSHPSVLMNRDFFEQLGGFDISLKYCMDYDLWLRAAQKTIPIAMPFTIGKFREHQGSLSSSQKLAVTEEAFLVRQCYTNSLWQRYKSWRSYYRRKKKLAI